MTTALDELAGWVDIYRAAQDTIAKAEDVVENLTAQLTDDPMFDEDEII